MYIDGKHADKTEKIYRRNINETAVNVIPNGVVTCLSASDTDILRIYGARDNAFREIRTSGNFLNCAGDGNDIIIVTEKGEEDFNFGIYDINGIEKQSVKGKMKTETEANGETPGKTVKYPKALAESRYNKLGKQAVVITDKIN